MVHGLVVMVHGVVVMVHGLVVEDMVLAVLGADVDTRWTGIFLVVSRSHLRCKNRVRQLGETMRQWSKKLNGGDAMG